MAKACVLNVWDRGRLLLEKLLAEGRVASVEPVLGQPMYCFEFTGELELTLEDYIKVSPPYMYRDSTMLGYLKEEFKNAIVLTVVKTLEKGVIEDYSDFYVVVRDEEKTEMLTVRVTREEKARLEAEAEAQGLTLSEYVRSRLFPGQGAVASGTPA